MATGLVVVGELIGSNDSQERTVVGETPNLAARLQALASPGQIVVAETSRRLLGNLFQLTDLGAQSLKGLSTPVTAYAMQSVSGVESHFEAYRTRSLGAMVGRDYELDLLCERWRQAKTGDGQLVMLSGEADIGKSRLLRAVTDAVSADPHTYIHYQCSPYHCDSPLYRKISALCSTDHNRSACSPANIPPTTFEHTTPNSRVC